MDKTGYIGYCGNNTALIRTDQNFNMFCKTDDDGMMPHLYTSGKWQPALTRFINSLNLQGKTCIDVGANIGYFSLLFANRGAKQVYSFEPIKELSNLIKRASKFNGGATGKTIFHIHNCGLSDKETTFSFLEEISNRGGSRIVEDGERANTTIKAKPLDYYKINDVAFIKIDVEGHEAQVLMGAKQTIEESSDITIVMEWNPSYANPKELTKVWEELNLKPFILRSSGNLEEADVYKLNGFEEIVLNK